MPTIVWAGPAVAGFKGPAEGQVRLVRLANDATPYGLEFRLAPGWHTYWALPGDAGLPPRIEADGVEVAAQFPKPIAFDEGGMVAFGYGDSAVLPLQLPLVVDGRPNKITVDYGVCADICIPVHVTLSIAENLPLVNARAVPGDGGQIMAHRDDQYIVVSAPLDGMVLLAVGDNYAVQMVPDAKGRLVADMRSTAEAGRAFTLPLGLYVYGADGAVRHAVQPSSGGSN
ncbi:MAG: protein-disulfide reductase DsbD domain-containing protein [Alphaproteobacteria bacterium]